MLRGKSSSTSIELSLPDTNIKFLQMTDGMSQPKCIKYDAIKNSHLTE